MATTISAPHPRGGVWMPLVAARRVARRSLPRPALIALTACYLVLMSLGGEAVYQQTAAPAPTSEMANVLGDHACHADLTQPRLLTQAELTRHETSGYRLLASGKLRRCELPGLPMPAPNGGAPSARGQVILVSLAQQWLWAYQDGRLVFSNPVATGQPDLQTPSGTYRIQGKLADVMFYSPWAPDSPYYYAPEHINYALPFRAGGFYIHDAPWRATFGPGSQVPHATPGGGWETGSHGCVNVTTRAAAWLYAWVAPGASLLIR
ncbi:MAG TPA: L,D-transpeptidase [Ktedonobacterales bacterium]